MGLLFAILGPAKVKMRTTRPAAKSWLERAGGLFVAVLLVGVVAGSAQSLGEVARRERERKQAQPRAPRVYTNEDLVRPQILDPEDRTRFEAQRQTPAVVLTERATQVPNGVASPAELPLGDVTRYYRALKQMRDQQPLVGEAALPAGGSLGELPLGDVARYYRRLKELREQGLLGEKAVLPSVAPLAAPTPSRLPAGRPGASDLTTAPPPRVREPVRSRRPENRNRIRVRRGDSLWKLARRHLGEGVRWREIAALNPELSNPHHILPGQALRLPDASASATSRKVRVQPGDSMWKLARAEFGSGFAWACIAQANPQVENANLIYPGQVLRLPAGCSSIP